MQRDLLIKIKKTLKVFFLIVVAFVLLLLLSTVYFATRMKETATMSTYSSQGYAVAIPSGISRGYINVGGMKAQVPPSAPRPAVSEDASTISVGSDNGTIIVDKKITQNGYLSLTVEQVETGITALSKIANDLGGSVDSIQYSDSSISQSKNAVVVFRVPAANFDQAMEQAKVIALKVSMENIATNDVTDQFIDVQARLKNLKAVELQYQALLQKAQSVKDIMTVTDQLRYIREEIDQLQGQMNYLSRQVDMSIITVSLSSDSRLGGVVWHPSTTVNEAMQGFLQGFYGFLKVLIFTVLFLIPIFALWFVVIGLIVWFFWVIIRNVYKKLHK